MYITRVIVDIHDLRLEWTRRSSSLILRNWAFLFFSLKWITQNLRGRFFCFCWKCIVIVNRNKGRTNSLLLRRVYYYLMLLCYHCRLILWNCRGFLLQWLSWLYLLHWRFLFIIVVIVLGSARSCRKNSSFSWFIFCDNGFRFLFLWLSWRDMLLWVRTFILERIISLAFEIWRFDGFIVGLGQHSFKLKQVARTFYCLQ